MPLNQCGLQAAESNRAVLRYLKEDDDCWGVTPATGSSREMRITQSSLTANKDTVISNELRADRMIPDVIEVARSSGGDVSFEFSAGSLDDFMQAFLLGTWTRSMTFDKFSGSSVSITDGGAATRIDIAGGDYSAYFAVGQRLKTEGFTNPANNNYWQIASLSYNITVSGATSLVMTTDLGVTEAANAYGTVMDANDVVILQNTAIRAGTAGANAFDSNGGNAFSTAISAGQLPVGSKLFVDFTPAYETGTFTVLGTHGTSRIVFGATPVVDTDAFSVAHEGVTVTFEFDTPDGVTGGRTAISIASGTVDGIGAAAVTAINGTALGSTLLASYDNASNTLTLTALTYTAIVIVEVTDGGAQMAVTNNVIATVASVVDADTVTINDGVNSVTFEFDDDGSFARGNVGVTLSATSSSTTATNLQAAIMDQLRKKKIRASASVSGAVVTVRNLERDQVDNAATTALTDTTTAVTTVTFAQNFTEATGDDPVPPFGVFTIVSVVADVITVAENVGTHANGGTVKISMKCSHLRNPGDLDDITAQSFSIETGFTDKGLYFLQTGLRVGSFELQVAAGELVGGKVAFMGKETSVDDVSTLGLTPYDVLATTATPILNATVNVGNIYKNGSLLATALQSIALKGEAALREQKAVGSTFPAGIGTGRFNLTGKMTTYFETLEMYDHFLAHDTISLAFDFLDGDKNAYWFTIPALKITTDPIAPGGIDQDVLEEMEFVALRDPNLNTQFMVDRFSSQTPVSA